MNAMSENALRWAWNKTAINNDSDTLLLLALATLSDSSGVSSPTLETLEKMTCVGVCQIRFRLGELHKKGVIKVSTDHIKIGVIKKRKPKDADAEEIYAAYPRKEGTAAAKAAISKALKKIVAHELFEAVQAYALAKEGEDKKFIPMPATWFNQERWKDDRDMWKTERKAALTEPPQWKLDNLAKALGAVEQAETALRRSRRLAAGRIGWEDGRSNREEHENLARAKKEVERWA